MDEAGENSSLSTHTYKFLDNDYDKKAQVFLSQRFLHLLEEQVYW